MTGATTLDSTLSVAGTINSMTIGASGLLVQQIKTFVINSPNGFRVNIDSNNTETQENFVVGNNQTDAAANNILFKVTESGKASIGHGSANANLHIGSSAATGDATNPAFQIGGASTYRLGMYTGSEDAIIENKNGDDGIQFKVKTAGEAMRIDGGTGNVGIGVTSPTATLDVDGTIKLDGNYPTGTANVALGNTALNSLTTGGNNTAIGRDVLTAATEGDHNTAVGSAAMESITDSFNIGLGSSALGATTTGGIQM